MAAKNTPIGEVECPHKGCSQTCKVYEFKTRGVRKDGTPRPSVFTHKKYLVCPDHGRIGADGSQRITEYILDNGKIWGAKKPSSTGGEKFGSPAGADPDNPQSKSSKAPARPGKPSRKNADSSPQTPPPKRSIWSPPW